MLVTLKCGRHNCSLSRGHSYSYQSYVTTVTLRRDQEHIVHLHHLIAHVVAQSSAAAMFEEESCGKTNLHVCKMQTKANMRASTEGHIGSLLLCCHLSFVHEPRAIESITMSARFIVLISDCEIRTHLKGSEKI